MPCGRWRSCCARGVSRAAAAALLAASLAGCAPADPGPRNHSQQVPVPGFAPAAPVAPGLFGIDVRSAEERTAIFFLSAATDCRPLEGGLRPAFACRTAEGHSFVKQ